MKLRERTGSLSKPGGWRILLVDDHEGCLSSQKASIMYGGKTEVVCTANNFTEALDLVRSERFDLIALDLYMDVPARDGVTFLTRLRQEGHAGPIVMLTSETSYKWFAKSIMAGADDFWIKTDRPRLHELVKQILEPSSRTVAPRFARIGFLQTSGLKDYDIELLSAWYDGFPRDVELARRFDTIERKIARRITEKTFKKLGITARYELAHILTLCAVPRRSPHLPQV